MKQLAEAFEAAQAFNQEEIDLDQALTDTLHTRRYTAQDRRSFRDALWHRQLDRLWSRQGAW